MTVSHREVLAVLKPTGDVFVNGLASSYDDEFPTSPESAARLETYMTREDFSKAMKMLNDALMDHWPCVPCTGFAYGCCVCTLGLSFYCATTQVQEAESRMQLQLRRLNSQSKFKQRGVHWRLERSLLRHTSFVEISVDPDAAATSLLGLSGSKTVDTDAGSMAFLSVAEDTGSRDEHAAEAVHDETMNDQVV